jgi:hypothetical protein
MTTSIGSSTSYPATIPALSETADIQVALRLLAYGTSTDPANDAAIAVNSTFGRAIYRVQPSVTALTATATLTIANLLTYIVTVTSTTAVTLTLPTGTLSDAGVQGGTAPNNTAFDWSVINLGSSAGAVTMAAAASGHTYVGSTGVAIGTSARFRTVKTATNTFVTYRVG